MVGDLLHILAHLPDVCETERGKDFLKIAAIALFEKVNVHLFGQFRENALRITEFVVILNVEDIVSDFELEILVDSLLSHQVVQMPVVGSTIASKLHNIVE